MANNKVKLIGALDMLEFKNMKSKREKEIDITVPEIINGDFSINKNAKAMHPDVQNLIVEEVIEHSDCEAKTYVLSTGTKKKPAYFRAGQAISLKLQIDNSFVTRPYSISSSPKEVLQGKYKITIKKKENGFVSNYILNNFEKGTKVQASAPYGNFYYENLRDKKNVIAIAGGSGITPFMSMAQAVVDGIEDFNLTILYGNNDSKSILFKNELDELQSKCDKIKVIYSLANEQKEGYEYGFISSDLISKYAQGPYSIFVSGPEGLHEFIKKEIKVLNKPRKEVRYDTLSTCGDITKEFNYPKEAIGKTFKIKVIQGPETIIIDANSNETILTALEKAGIKAPSKCRGGECGWCRSKLLLGNVYNNEKPNQRRYVDIEFNYIHPCCTYPIADCTIEVPSEYI